LFAYQLKKGEKVMKEKESNKLRNLLKIHSELQNQVELHEVMIRTAKAKIDVVLDLVREILAKDKKPLTGGKA
jgi:hypothetical protein